MVKEESAKGKIATPRASEGKPSRNRKLREEKEPLRDASLASIRQAQKEGTRDNPQPYHSLSEFTYKHSLVLPKGKVYNQEYPWRLTQHAPNGQITGLDKLSGKAIATNGILVAIESPTGFVRIGHMNWFEVLEYDEISAKELPTARHPKKPAARRYTAEEVDMLLE